VPTKEDPMFDAEKKPYSRSRPPQRRRLRLGVLSLGGNVWCQKLGPKEKVVEVLS
jgi:hypothetical protein